MDKKNTTKSYVYLLHAQGSNRFKIGYSEDPVRRQQGINNVSSPFPIVLVGCYLPDKNAYSEEQRLHRELSDRRVYGEWFEFDSVDQAKEIVGSKLGIPDIKNSQDFYESTNLLEQKDRLFFRLTKKLDTNNKNNKNNKNKVIITRKILKEMISKATQDLILKPETGDDYAAKSCAIQILTGRRFYSEIFNPEHSFITKELTHLLTQQIPDKEPIELIESNLTLIRSFVLKKKECKTPLRTLLSYPLIRSLMSYDKLLKEVRDANNDMPRLEFNLKKEYLRSFYAFSCWVFLDRCQSTESEYTNSLFNP